MKEEVKSDNFYWEIPNAAAIELAAQFSAANSI